MNTLSWHLNLNINNVRNLFSQIELPYEIDCYVCSCGHNEIIIKEQKGILDYICLHCENEFFCNANFIIITIVGMNQFMSYLMTILFCI